MNKYLQIFYYMGMIFMNRRNLLGYPIFLIFVIISLNCGNNDQGLTGRWNWVKTEGGDFAHILYTPPPVIKLIFDNNICIIYRNDNIISERNYYLTRENTACSDTQNIITFVDIRSDTTINPSDWYPIPGIGKYSYHIHNDNLILDDLSCAIGAFFYLYSREY